MSEREEIKLIEEQKTWQAKQDFSGTVTMALCAAALCGFLYFINSRNSQSAVILLVCLALLLAACARMVACAAKVMEVRHSLQPARVRARGEVIDAEVIDTPRHGSRR